MGSAYMLPVDDLIDTRANAVRDVFGLQRMIKDVRVVMETRSKKEVDLMESKNKQMIDTLNQIKYENGQSTRRLEALQLEIKKDGQCIVKKDDVTNRNNVCVCYCRDLSKSVKRQVKCLVTRLIKKRDLKRLLIYVS